MVENDFMGSLIMGSVLGLIVYSIKLKYGVRAYKISFALALVTIILLVAVL